MFLKCLVVSWHMALSYLSLFFFCLFVVSENQIPVGTEVSLFSTVIRRKLCSKWESRIIEFGFEFEFELDFELIRFRVGIRVEVRVGIVVVQL